jgi:Fe-S oxidoreductase
MRILHHSQYINELLETGEIKVNQSNLSIVFHNPCELGRNSGIYNEPLRVINYVGNLQTTIYDGKESLCCGHSIASEALSYRKRRIIAEDAVIKLSANNPDVLATACPACKKAFSEIQMVKVKDIAEIVAERIKK